jgi:hypothetical protein
MELLAMKRTFHYVHRENSESLGIAYAPPPINNDTIPLNGEVRGWQPLELRLKSGSFTDFLSSNIIWHLCSERVRRIVDRFRVPGDGIEWLEVRVTNGRISRPYYILHLTHSPDTIDPARTIFEEDGAIRKAVLDPDKARGIQVFRYPDDRVRLVISDEVKRALEHGDCTGMEFTEVPQVAK